MTKFSDNAGSEWRDMPALNKNGWPVREDDIEGVHDLGPHDIDRRINAAEKCHQETFITATMAGHVAVILAIIIMRVFPI